jgi:hypothetical protein
MTVDCLCTPKPHPIIHDRSLSLYPENTYYYTWPLTVFVPLKHILLYMTAHSLLIYFLVKSQWYLRPWYYVTSFYLFVFSYSASLVIPPHFCDYSKSRSGFPSIYLVVFLLSMFNELRWVDIVRFVDIGWIIDHHSLSCLCFVDIGGIIDHPCLSCL